MNDPHSAKPRLMDLLQVFLNNSRHISWRDCVKIDHVRNLNLNQFGKRVVRIDVNLVGESFGWSAARSGDAPLNKSLSQVLKLIPVLFCRLRLLRLASGNRRSEIGNRKSEIANPCLTLSRGHLYTRGLSNPNRSRYFDLSWTAQFLPKRGPQSAPLCPRKD